MGLARSQKRIRYLKDYADTRCLLYAELDNVDDIDQLPVPEKEGTILEEWMSE